MFNGTEIKDGLTRLELTLSLQSLVETVDAFRRLPNVSDSSALSAYLTTAFAALKFSVEHVDEFE